MLSKLMVSPTILANIVNNKDKENISKNEDKKPKAIIKKNLILKE